MPHPPPRPPQGNDRNDWELVGGWKLAQGKVSLSCSVYHAPCTVLRVPCTALHCTAIHRTALYRTVLQEWLLYNADEMFAAVSIWVI